MSCRAWLLLATAAWKAVPHIWVCLQDRVYVLWWAFANTSRMGLYLVLDMWPVLVCISVSLLPLSFYFHIFGKHFSGASTSTSPLHSPSPLSFLLLSCYSPSFTLSSPHLHWSVCITELYFYCLLNKIFLLFLL